MMRGMIVEQLLAGTALGSIVFLSGCGRTHQAGDAPPPTSQSVVATRPAPPPAHAISLAGPASATTGTEATLADRLTRLGSLSPEAEAALQEASFEGKAESSLVVLAGGRQADVARPPRDRHERWEIRFPAGTSVEAYSRQLDFFKIELGVIGGQQQVTYLSNLSNPKPTSRSASAADDRRLYLIWQRGAIREVDEQIAARAGVPTAGKVVAHFLPKEVEDELARLEDARARQLSISSIGKTVFGITPSGQDSFRFTVLDLKADSP
jgi:hypothetical protein